MEHLDEVKNNDTDATSEVSAPRPGLALVPQDVAVEQVGNVAEAATADACIAAAVVPGVGVGDDHTGLMVVSGDVLLASGEDAALDVDAEALLRRPDLTDACVVEAATTDARIAAPVVPGVGDGVDHAGRATVAASAPLASSDEVALDAEAEELLARPDLTDAFLESIERRGLVGERDAALALFLSGITRVQEKPISVVVDSGSCSGKSELCHRVGEYFPPTDREEVSRLTAAGLEGRAPDLDHRILVLSELLAAKDAAYSLRVLISERKFATTRSSSTGKAITHQSKASLAVWMTTAVDDVDEELATRLLKISMDSSSAQTRAVIERQALEAASLPDPQRRAREDRELRVWQLAMAKIRAHEVVVPQARELLVHFEKAHASDRRSFPVLRSLVQGIALLHQRTRARAADGDALLTSDDDVAIARRLWTSPSIGADARSNALLDQIREAFAGEAFSASEVAREVTCAPDTARRKLNSLEELGWIERVGTGRGRIGARWRMVSAPPMVRELNPPSSESHASARSSARPGHEVGHVAAVQ
jgi:hypothetical protein